MTGQTVVRLWSRYLELRKEISAGAHDGEGLRETARQVDQPQGRLVVITPRLSSTSLAGSGRA